MELERSKGRALSRKIASFSRDYGGTFMQRHVGSKHDDDDDKIKDAERGIDITRDGQVVTLLLHQKAWCMILRAGMLLLPALIATYFHKSNYQKGGAINSGSESTFFLAYIKH